MMKYIFSSLFLLLVVAVHPGKVEAQERSLSGTVTTLKEIPVVNAEVRVGSSKAIVLTDTLGRFQVTCLPNDKLRISAKGFKSEKIKIDAQTKGLSIDLRFTPTEKQVDRVVQSGYIKEKDRNYAVTSIQNTDKNNFVMYSSMIDVIVNSSTSVEFRNGGFIIRGGSSLLGSNSALIIIDGREANITQLEMLAPAEVESVDILKGSSSSIYGARGANGVIIVNTKKR